MKVFITGITGTLGTELCKYLLHNYPDLEISGISRSWTRQQDLFHSLNSPSNVKLHVGCISDKASVQHAMRNSNYVVHCGALKCLHTCEINPHEALRVNISGSRNVFDCAASAKVKKTVFISSDKAALPCNVYGFTKAMGEKFALLNKRNAVCRYGNVVGSNGSVIPIFIKSLQENKVVNITDINSTRFWITKEAACKFVCDTVFSDSLGLCVPKMKAASVLRVALTLARLMGINDPVINFSGLKNGEKIDENLITVYERYLGEPLCSKTAEQYTDQELIEMLKPIVKEYV